MNLIQTTPTVIQTAEWNHNPLEVSKLRLSELSINCEGDGVDLKYRLHIAGPVNHTVDLKVLKGHVEIGDWEIFVTEVEITSNVSVVIIVAVRDESGTDQPFVKVMSWQIHNGVDDPDTNDDEVLREIAHFVMECNKDYSYWRDSTPRPNHYVLYGPDMESCHKVAMSLYDRILGIEEASPVWPTSQIDTPVIN